MANYYARWPNGPLQLGQARGAISAAGTALDSNYVYGTSGDGVLVRFVAPVTANLTTVYFFVSAVTGTPGNATVELRNNNAGKPGTTVHASQTDVGMGTTANKWIVCTFGTPYQVTANTQYWLCIGDADGSGTDYATVFHKSCVSQIDFSHLFTASYVTADGGQNVTAQSANAAMVFKYADGTLVGSPFTTNGADSSNTLMRGIHIEGLTEQLTLAAVKVETGTANMTGIKIFSGTAGPDDAAALTVTGDLSQSVFWLPTPYTLLKATVYNIVITYGSADANPGYYHNLDGAAQTDTIAAGLGGGTIYRCIDNSSDNTWALYTAKVPRMALIVQDQVAITASGGVVVAGGSNYLLT